MNNKTSDNTERLKQLAKELRESNEIKRFYGNNFTEGSKYCVVSEAELIPTAEAIEEVLAELEQKDKRIQELEEELAKYKDIDYMFKIDSNENRVDMKKIYFEWLNSISKQAVIDKIEEYKKQQNKYENELQEPFAFNYFHREALKLAHKIQALQELLEGEK